MSESVGMNVNRLTTGGQNMATDVKGNITTLPVNLRPAGATTAMNLTWDSDNKLRSADIDANGTADVNFQYDALGRRVARSGTGGSVVYVQMDQQTIADYPVGGAATTPTFRYVYASYIDEPVVRKKAGTGGTLVYFHRSGRCPVPGRQNAPELSTFKDSVLLADSLFFNAFDITHRPSLVEERFSRGVKSEVGEPAFA
jgi:YD repeat-containing protein